MKSKLDLLKKIQRLSAVVHSGDLEAYNLSEESVSAMRETLDKMTEQYVAKYCSL